MTELNTSNACPVSSPCTPVPGSTSRIPERRGDTPKTKSILKTNFVLTEQNAAETAHEQTGRGRESLWERDHQHSNVGCQRRCQLAASARRKSAARPTPLSRKRVFHPTDIQRNGFSVQYAEPELLYKNYTSKGLRRIIARQTDAQTNVGPTKSHS